MAKFADVNSTYAGATAGGLSVPNFAVKTVCKLAGWTVPRSSDGTTYNAGADIITVSGSGAGGLLNTGAWYIIQDPGGRRQVCVQSNNLGQLRIKYSANAKFTGGTPGATRVPTATDEQVLLGTGSDAVPTYAFLFSNGTARYHIVAESTPVGGAYYLGCHITNTGGATQANGMFVIEPMAPGSYNASDGDPVAIICGSSTTYGGSMSGWLAYGTGAQVWLTALTTSVGPFNGALGVDLGSSTDVNGRPWYSGTSGGSVRIKGVGAFVSAKGPARTYPATENTATDGYMYLGSWVFPYPNNTAPSVS